MKGYSRYFWFIHFIGDVFLINVAFIFTYYLKFESIDFSDKYRFLFIIFNTVWILVALMLKLYELNRIRRLDRITYNLFKAFIFNAFIISGILFSLKASEWAKTIDELMKKYSSDNNNLAIDVCDPAGINSIKDK